MGSERYTLFAQDEHGEISHVSHVDEKAQQFSCLYCQTALSITCIQCQDSDAYYPVFEHSSGVLCLKEHGLGLLLYANQLLHKVRQVKQPEYSVTLESVLTMVPGFTSRFYELPAQIQTYPSSIIHYDKIVDVDLPENRIIACLITTPSQVYGVAMSINADTGYIHSFDIDESGRLPIMIISLESSLERLLKYSSAQLDNYILNTSSREWLTHPVHVEDAVRLRQARYKLSLERAEQQSLTLRTLIKTEAIDMDDAKHTTEEAFCIQHYDTLAGLMRYEDVTLDVDLIIEHNRIIDHAGIQSLSHYQHISQTFPSGLPLPFDKSHIIALYASQKIDLTLGENNEYLDCYAVASWLTDALQIPEPLAEFINRHIFYCHDINRWRDIHGLLGTNEQRQLLLPVKRLLIFIWKLSQYRPNSNLHSLNRTDTNLPDPSMSRQ
jgi:hypothetical protein